MAYTLKTQMNTADVINFLDTTENPQKKEDCFELLKIFESLTQESGKMWGKNIIGFGSYHYIYASGQEGDWMRTGFAPRSSNITIYIMPGYELNKMKDLLEKLGKHKIGKSCLYIKKLSDIDLKVLEKIIIFGWENMKEQYPE